MRLKIGSLVAGAAVLLVSLVSPTVLAAPTGSSGAATSTPSTPTAIASSMRLAPVRSDIALDPGESKELTVYAQNLAPAAVRVKAIVSDFEASRDEGGDPLVILDNKYAKSHSLKRLANIDTDVFTLGPNERKAIKVTITAPKTAMAGGYYGAVRVLPAEAQTSEDTGVAVSTNLGSLVLLKVNGDIKEKVTLASMDVRQNGKIGSFFKKPENIHVVSRFNNQGNVQEAPFGKVKVTAHGKLVEEHEINSTEPKGNVLPDSIRRFETPLTKLKKFGRYTVEANFSYGTGGELITSKTSFWVVPVSYMIAAGVVLLILILAVVLIPRALGSYKKRILSRAGRRY